jgi:3-phenylpropionate/trans-cinnamate dioxygenase ferredoxin reductase subunit
MAADLTSRCVIVGGGQAGVHVAITMRQRGFAGPVALVTGEPGLPYQRPPLSKAFLAGSLSRERLAFRPAGLYKKLDIDLRSDATVVAIDRDQKQVLLANGAALPYDWLVLATGSRPRSLPVPGAELKQVAGLRTVDDAERIRSWLAPGRRLAIIGGGYIGLEVAAVAASAGARITVFEASTRLLARVTGFEIADFFAGVHRARGVQTNVEATVHGFEARPDGSVQVEFNGGQRIVADGVVVAVGVLPEIELAQSALLECADGVVVDDHGRTSDPSILAAGDCTNHPNDRLGRRLRLESVHNAIEQAKTVAATICGGSEPYAQVPWFWSDQYSFKLQSVGLSAGHERTVVHGSIADGIFSVYYLKDDGVIALDAVNLPRDFAHARAIFATDRSRGAVGLGEFLS